MEQRDNNVYFHLPGIATVRWDAKGLLVLVEWEGWANSVEFAALLDAEVRALSEHRGSRLLADCRRQRVLSPVDQERATRDWLSRALAAGLKRFAIVLPTSALATMNLKDQLEQIPSAKLDIGYFESVNKARAWMIR